MVVIKSCLKKSGFDQYCDFIVTRVKTASSPNRLSLPIAAVMIGSILTMSGCSQPEEYAGSATEEVSYTETEQSAEATAYEDLSNSIDGDGQSLEIENLTNDSNQTLATQGLDIDIAGKKLLINVRADFKVSDVVDSSSAIETLTRQQGGYVALSNINNVEMDRRTFNKGETDITLVTYYRQAMITVRVPRQKVTAFLEQVQEQVAFLNEQEFTAQDVTLDLYREQLATQLNSNLAADLNKQRLNSEKAPEQSSNIDAINATYAARRQQEYATLQRMDIEDKVKYSTITLTFRQPASSYKETTKNIDRLIDTQRPSFGAQVATAAEEGWETLKTALIKIISLWWLLIIICIFYLCYRFIKAIYRSVTGYKTTHTKAAKRAKTTPVHIRKDIDGPE